SSMVIRPLERADAVCDRLIRGFPLVETVYFFNTVCDRPFPAVQPEVSMANVLRLTEQAIAAVSEEGALLKHVGSSERLLAEAEKLGIKPVNIQKSPIENAPWLTFTDLHAIEPGTPTRIPNEGFYGEVTRRSTWKGAHLYENPEGITNS